jgi:hypothetical protein
MNGYNIPYDSSGKEPPGIAVGEPNPGEPIPVESNSGPGGDVGPLYGVNPMSLLYEELSAWFPTGDGHGGGEPPFCGTPPGPSDGPFIIPGYAENPSGPSEPLESW